MEKKIKWGIIGAGRIAEKFASDLKSTTSGELFAVSSTSLARAQDFALRHEAMHAFGNYEELFSVEVDVVYIATPHPFHLQHTLLCLNNGIPVLCEKPFGMEESEVNQMIATAREKKVFLMEAMWTRFLPSTLKTLEIIQSGVLGKIITLHADFGFKAIKDFEGRAYNQKLGGGALLDIGIYPIYLSLLILGYPSSIKASSIFAQTGVDETTSMLYQYDNESTALLNCTFGCDTNCEAIIYGELGKITIHTKFHESKKVTLHLKDQEPVVFDFPRDTFGYNYEADEVHACLQAGKLESEIFPLSASQKLIHLLDKTREAAKIVY
jgi:predicted dehydrogenase